MHPRGLLLRQPEACLRGKSDLCVRRPVPGVAAALDELEEKPLVEGAGIELEILAGVVTIVKNIIGFDDL